MHYDLPLPTSPFSTSSRGRTFAQLLGAGLTTPNLTSSHERPCLPDHHPLERSASEGARNNSGVWHQATNALRLVLCVRDDRACARNDASVVFFAVVHRKYANVLKLPMRYERYVLVWAGAPPFEMLGVSRYPILLANETATGWSAWQNWDDDNEGAGPRTRAGTGTAKVAKDRKRRDLQFWPSWNHTNTTTDDTYGLRDKGYWAYFTYTVSMAWAWGREGVEIEDMGEGFLDDEVVLSIGIEDKGQGVARMSASDLVQCLKACPALEGSVES